MVYIDQNGNELESIDLSLGYLEDAEWIDHPEIPRKVHYEYLPLEGGGQLQKIIVDQEYTAPWREVTVQRYILYTEDELLTILRSNYDLRILNLETMFEDYEQVYLEGVNEA